MPSFDLSSFVGSKLETIEQSDLTWFLRFSEKQVISTESVWRALSEKGVLAGSSDHGAIFGRLSPFDLITEIQAIIGDRCVKHIEISKPTGDLTVDFDGGIHLHFPTLSCGYESWRISIGTDEEIVCQGGGTIIRIK